MFSPLFGFSSISAPSISLETEEVKDGTFQFPRHLAKGASVGSVSFERAASPFDSDFYDWITHAIYGSKVSSSGGSLSHAITNALGAKSGLESWRRKIVIIQFTGINVAPDLSPDSITGRAAVAAGVAALAGLGALVGGGVGLAANIGIGALGPFSLSPKLPARGWVLHGCVPINYRAASDFDARSGNISLMSLEVQPEYIEEWSLGVKP